MKGSMPLGLRWNFPQSLMTTASASATSCAGFGVSGLCMEVKNRNHINPMPPDAKMADSLRNPEQREATPHGMHTYQTK